MPNKNKYVNCLSCCNLTNSNYCKAYLTIISEDAIRYYVGPCFADWYTGQVFENERFCKKYQEKDNV